VLLRCTNPSDWGCERRGTHVNLLNPITSARIRTVESISFRYGQVEVRAKLPAGDWLWPGELWHIYMSHLKLTAGSWLWWVTCKWQLGVGSDETLASDNWVLALMGHLQVTAGCWLWWVTCKWQLGVGSNVSLASDSWMLALMSHLQVTAGSWLWWVTWKWQLGVGSDKSF
jgi:hypothetical protein